MNALGESFKRGRNEGPVMVEIEHFQQAFRELKPCVLSKGRVQAKAMRYGDKETEYVKSGDSVNNDNDI